MGQEQAEARQIVGATASITDYDTWIHLAIYE
jgi:hypothetical protein